jgi:putative transposase
MFVPRRQPSDPPFVDLWNRPTIIYLTACAAWRDVNIFAWPRAHRALLQAWGQANGWRVGRYVLMPDHVHLFCSPSDDSRWTLQAWVAYWKRLTTIMLRREDRQGSIWQRGHWDRQLRSGESYDEKWRYVCANPEREGLVEDAQLWPYQGEMHVLPW